MGTLEFTLKVIEMQIKVIKRMCLTFYLMDHLSMNMLVQLRVPLMVYLKAPTFEAKIKGVIEVTNAFHMNIHIVLQKSAHNNSMNDELQEALYVSLEGFSLKRLQNNGRFLLMNLVLK